MTARQSKYTYSNSETLINRFGFTDEEALNKEEAKYTYGRMVELEMEPDVVVVGMHEQLFPGKKFTRFSKEHLLSIHAFIFQDVYPLKEKELKEMGFADKKPWIGDYREENIAKGNFRFADARFVEQSLEYVFADLHNEKVYDIKDKEKLAERIAYYIAELNVVHPMREGNGRTIREMARQISLEAGWDIDWSTIKDKIVPATIIASIKDITLLKEVIIEAMVENNELSKTL